MLVLAALCFISLHATASAFPTRLGTELRAMCQLVAATSRGLPIPMRLSADYYPTRACTFRASPAHAFYPLSTAGGEILSIASLYRETRARFPAVWSHPSPAPQTSFNRPALGFAHRPRSGLLVSRGFAFITTDVPHDVRLPSKTKKPLLLHWVETPVLPEASA